LNDLNSHGADNSNSGEKRKPASWLRNLAEVEKRVQNSSGEEAEKVVSSRRFSRIRQNEDETKRPEN
jgi:hypothetical protein